MSTSAITKKIRDRLRLSWVYESLLNQAKPTKHLAIRLATTNCVLLRISIETESSVSCILGVSAVFLAYIPSPFFKITSGEWEMALLTTFHHHLLRVE